ncbi:hypothetical protein Bca52824_018162 [Brassica carinata]|uniref:Uncharacterized protein n=1 Tax=Brassica carinata TaxID=52824 RepID=A0A8X8AX58_BRACI|nr:hypothetical protein Bca52824_018162 [Brassica carinata]
MQEFSSFSSQKSVFVISEARDISSQACHLSTSSSSRPFTRKDCNIAHKLDLGRAHELDLVHCYLRLDPEFSARSHQALASTSQKLHGLKKKLKRRGHDGLSGEHPL